MTRIQAGPIIVFQGDSISACFRDKLQHAPNHPTGLGRGFPFLVSAELLAEYPTSQLQIFNRAVSGNRIVDMYARWREDCLNLKPDLVNILIGVNDTIFELRAFAGSGPERFKMIYELAIRELLAAAPACKIVICEPFLLPISDVTHTWIKHLEFTQGAVRKLAADHGCVFVPFQKAFTDAQKKAPAEYWLYDGIHPTPAGAHLMAAKWKELVDLRSILDIK